MPKQPNSSVAPESEPIGSVPEVREPHRRIAILGAGPIGLEAAHYALRSGFTVRLFEAGPEIAPQLSDISHLTLFSNWGELRTPVGEAALMAADSGNCDKLPRSVVHPEGEEFVRRYLEPLAAALPPKSLWLNHRVVAVARPFGAACCERSASGIRAGVQRPHRILTRNTQSAEERAWASEYVIDCTGGGRTPAWLGAGGIPAVGEMGCSHNIVRRIPDIEGRDRMEFAGKKILLVGDGSSAATSAVLLAELAEAHPGSQVMWAVNHDRELPCQPAARTPDSARRAMVFSKANLLVKSGRSYLAYSKSTQVEEMRYNYDAGKFYVTFQIDRQTKRYQFDKVIANVGWRTDSPYLSEVPAADPTFFDVSATMCTCNDHAIRRGQLEIREIFQRICGDPALDLYGFEGE